MGEHGQFRRSLIGTVARMGTRTALGRVVDRFVLGGLIIFTLLILISPTRTIQIQARALSAQVILTGEPLDWDLTDATVCLPTDDFDSAPTAPCGVAEDFYGRLDGPVLWPRDQALALNWTPEALQIQLLTATDGWPKGTMLRVDRDAVLRNGALAFSGYLTLGQEMSAGARGYVLEGTYAIYERGLVSRWSGGSPDVTRQGQIHRGDQVRIVCRERFWQDCLGDRDTRGEDIFLNWVAASISPDHDGDAGFHVVATGAEANSLLEVSYAGRDKVLLIEPSWVQRVVTSSSVLALTLLISLLAPLILSTIDRNRKNADRPTPE